MNTERVVVVQLNDDDDDTHKHGIKPTFLQGFTCGIRT